MENSNGWRYGGDGFMELVGTLQEDIQAELKEHALHVNIVVSPLAWLQATNFCRCWPALFGTLLEARISSTHFIQQNAC
jgi:hypothetical protein